MRTPLKSLMSVSTLTVALGLTLTGLSPAAGAQQADANASDAGAANSAGPARPPLTDLTPQEMDELAALDEGPKLRSSLCR